MSRREIWQAQALAERGLILLILRDSIGPAVDLTTVRAVMARLGQPIDKGHALRHMAYLEEQGFVRSEAFTAVGLTRRLYEITAVGRNVLLGAHEDPGVVVPEVFGEES